MKSLFLTTLLSAAVAISALAQEAKTQNTEKEKSEGWEVLFDGTNIDQNWRGYKKDKAPDGWKVEDGALVRKGGGGDLMTKEQYDAFELALEYKISEGGNSGLMFHVLETDGPPWATGPEVQILDNVKGKDPNKSGWMYALYPATKDLTKPAGEWNSLRLIVRKDGKAEHWMNGEKIVEYQIGSEDWNQKVATSKFGKMEGFGKAGKGHIVLQDHGDEVAFRNIKIRRLSEK